MRYIEFRAKADYNNEWVYGMPIHYNRNQRTEKWTIRETNALGLESDVDPETIGELTGLFDRDFKCIYEGDIVEREDGKKYLVIFKEGKFFAAEDMKDPFLCKGAPLWTLTKMKTPCKVIGNKYDNPELLEGG